MVWTCHEERVRRKKSDENEVTEKEEKREAKEKIFRCSKEKYGQSWCKGEGHCKHDALEKQHTLWLLLIKEKGRNKKKKKIFAIN